MNKKDIKKRNIVIVGITTIIVMITLLFIIFRDEIEQKNRERELKKMAWETDTLGSVESVPDPESTTEPPRANTMQDSLGNTYEEINFFNLDYNVFLPEKWDKSVSNGIVKAINNDKDSDTYQVEITVMPLFKYDVDASNPLPSLWALRNKTGTNIQRTYRYRGYNDAYSITALIMSKSNEPKNRLLYQPMEVRMESDNNVIFKPHISSYFRYINNRGFCILVTGHETLEVPIDVIAKTVSENIKDNKQEMDVAKADPIILDSSAVLGADDKPILEFGINKNWIPVAVNQKSEFLSDYTCAYRITDDIKSPDYGITLSVTNAAPSDLDLRSYDKKTNYLHCMNYPDEKDMFTAMEKEGSMQEYTVYEDEKKTTAAGVGKWYEYQKTYNYISSDAYYRAIEMSSLIDGNFCFICHSENEKLDVVFNITYNDKNYERARQILMRVLDSVK